MSFETTLNRLPFTATTENGRGFLPPYLRGMSHLLYLLGRAEDNARTTEQFYIDELDQSLLHWNECATTNAFTDAASTHLRNFKRAVNDYRNEFQGWARAERLSRLQDLIHRGIQLGAVMDRELAGISNSDPGSRL